MAGSQPDKVLALALSQGVLRARDLDPLGIPRAVLGRLVKRGDLIKVARGLYIRSDAEVTEHHTLATVAARVPGAVVNLLSALSFHGLTDELPPAVWIAIKRGSQSPRLDTPSLEVTWTAPRYLEFGVTRHLVEGVGVPVTEPARTVADCFKFRRRVGLDVAIAGLRDYLVQHRGGRDSLWRMAGECRVQTVLRPYLETLS